MSIPVQQWCPGVRRIHIPHQIDRTSSYCALYWGNSWGENGCSKRRQAGSCECALACVGWLFSFSFFFFFKRCTWAFSKTQQAGHYSLRCHLQPFHPKASASFLSLFHTIYAQANCVCITVVDLMINTLKTIKRRCFVIWRCDTWSPALITLLLLSWTKNGRYWLAGLFSLRGFCAQGQDVETRVELKGK